MTNYSSASSGVNGIPQQMDNYLSSSIAVLLDAAPLQTQLPVPIPSRADYAADYPFERNSAPYVVRSPPPVFQHAEAPAMIHSFQHPQGPSFEITSRNYDCGTFGSQTHLYTVQVDRPEPYEVFNEPFNNNDLNSPSSMPFKIVRGELNGAERYFCIDLSTGEKRGPVDISDVLQHPLCPLINYQIGVHR